MWLFTTFKGLFLTTATVAYLVAAIYLAVWAFSGFWDVVTFITGVMFATWVFVSWYDYTFNLTAWFKSK